MLREGGTFVAKFFKGADLSYLHVMMKQLFVDVYVVKPQSSRASSAEAFVVGIGYKPGSNVDGMLSQSMMGLKEKLDGQVESTAEGGKQNPETAEENGSSLQQIEEQSEEEEDDVLTF